jgi:eukaryotic-like serine/threonine-protein kinase
MAREKTNMTEVAEESGKSSSLTDLTLEVRQSGGTEQEVFLQHGLSLGRNASNGLCIDHPDVERIHAQVMRQPDGTMLLECASPTTQVTLPDGKKVHQLVLKPGTTFKIGPATVRCLKRQTKPSVVVTDNPWQVQCPRCHEVVTELAHDAKKCPGCKTELFYFKEKLAADVPPEAGFQGWLPRQIGPYQIRAFVAQGGMGIVLRGLHKENDMPAAVKLLKGDPDHDPSWKARFEAEITTLTSLKHPNVVRLQASGRDEKLLWLAMDWIDGVPISNWIAKARAGQTLLPMEQIRQAMTQIVSGLQYLHRQQIIHRDLKPSNILVSQDDLVKMVDFGIARSSSGNTAAATRLTQTGMITGTESYMAPEQAEGRPVTPASDIYALGVIWYELLTNRRPMGSFVSVELVRADTPPAWARAIAQCLSSDPGSRPSLDDLTRAIAGIAAPPPMPSTPTYVPPGRPPMGQPMTGTNPAVPPPLPPTGHPPQPYPGQPTTPSSGVGEKLHHGAQIAGDIASKGAHATADFLKKHPPKEWMEKLGPVGNAIRKNPKIWIGAGIVGGLLLVILLIRGLSDSPKTTTATNTPNPAAPAAAGENTPAVPNNPNPLNLAGQQQQATPNPAAAQPNPLQMIAMEAQAYQMAEQRMAQNVMYAQFPPLGNPNVVITPQADGSFEVRSLCQGFYPGRGMGTLPFTCVVHHTDDGNWSADNPQY